MDKKGHYISSLYTFGADANYKSVITQICQKGDIYKPLEERKSSRTRKLNLYINQNMDIVKATGQRKGDFTLTSSQKTIQGKKTKWVSSMYLYKDGVYFGDMIGTEDLLVFLCQNLNFSPSPEKKLNSAFNMEVIIFQGQKKNKDTILQCFCDGDFDSELKKLTNV